MPVVVSEVFRAGSLSGAGPRRGTGSLGPTGDGFRSTELRAVLASNFHETPPKHPFPLWGEKVCEGQMKGGIVCVLNTTRDEKQQACR